MMAVLVLVPALVYAQVNEDDQYDIQDDTFGGIISNDQTVGPVGIVDELYEAHSDVTLLMENRIEIMGNVGYVEEEVYLEGTYVDEENMTLVIWLDPAQMFDPIDEEDILEELGIDVPIEIKYGFFQLHASSSEATSCMADSGSSICYYWGRYVDRCLPTKTTSRCNTYATIISGAGYALPTLIGSTPGPVDTDNDGILDTVDQCDSQPETQNGYQDADGCPDTVPVVASGGTIFQDDFANGLSNWTVSGQQEWQSGTNDDGRSIPGYTLSNRIAEADDCDDRACILSMTQPLDLSGYTSATLEFHRYVDANHDYGEYLAVEVGNNGDYTQVLRWTHGDGDDQTWHKETVNLSSYLQSGFNVRFVTEQSSSSEDVGIDNVKIVGEASTECVLDIVATLEDGTITGTWNDCGENIRYYKTYLEKDGRNSYLARVYGTSVSSSNLSEGSNYSIKVKALYEDTRKLTGLFTSNTVTVPVVDRDGPVITVPSDITVDATSSSGAVVSFVVSGYDNKDGNVSVSCSHSSGYTFPVGSTTVTCTAADLAGNDSTARFTVNVNAYAEPPINCGDSSTMGTDGSCPDDTSSRHYVRGGDPIRVFGFFINYPLDGFEATAGLVIDYNDKPALLTASHTVRALGYSNMKLDLGGTQLLSWPEIGSTILANSDVGGGSTTKSDAILIEVSNSDIISPINQIQTNEGILDVISFGTSDSYDRGTQLEISARKNDGIGHITYTNVTAVTDFYTLTNQVSASYSSEMGDSGGPIFVNHGNGTATMLGIVAGGFCGIDADGISLEILDSYGNCRGVFNVFSPWPNIAQELGVE